MIQKLIIEAAIKLLAKKFKLDKVLAYVEDDNELDIEVAKLKKEVKKLKRDCLKFTTGVKN
mgnify:CR=1 FL=1|tara:strand:- start:151 stop:333 length:183 start_codon:yes stop_codon:yes gene_type:complete